MTWDVVWMFGVVTGAVLVVLVIYTGQLFESVERWFERRDGRCPDCGMSACPGARRD